MPSLKRSAAGRRRLRTIPAPRDRKGRSGTVRRRPSLQDGERACTCESGRQSRPQGSGRPLACKPDGTVTVKALICTHRQAALTEGDRLLHGRYDKIDLPPVHPVVTRGERYAEHCPCCYGIILAPVPEGVDEGSPLRVNNLALATQRRTTHAVSHQRPGPAVSARVCPEDQRGDAARTTRVPRSSPAWGTAAPRRKVQMA